MLLALTCALCTIQPLPTTLELSLPEPTLHHQEADPAAPLAPLELASAPQQAASQGQQPPLALAPPPMQGTGSGDGEHSDHMSPMWIMMGAMMVVMVVGAGVYMMNHRSTAARPFNVTTIASPAMLAIPVVSRAGGGG